MLETAVINGYQDVVRALLRNGCDSQACDSEGRTVLHLAAEESDDGGVVRALLEDGADIERPTTLAYHSCTSVPPFAEQHLVGARWLPY